MHDICTTTLSSALQGVTIRCGKDIDIMNIDDLQNLTQISILPSSTAWKSWSRARVTSISGEIIEGMADITSRRLLSPGIQVRALVRDISVPSLTYRSQLSSECKQAGHKQDHNTASNPGILSEKRTIFRKERVEIPVVILSDIPREGRCARAKRSSSSPKAQYQSTAGENGTKLQ